MSPWFSHYTDRNGRCAEGSPRERDHDTSVFSRYIAVYTVKESRNRIDIHITEAVDLRDVTRVSTAASVTDVEKRLWHNYIR